MPKPYSFSVSEVLHDGRVMVFTYARQGYVARVLMLVYDAQLQNPETVLTMTIPTKGFDQ